MTFGRTLINSPADCFHHRFAFFVITSAVDGPYGYKLKVLICTAAAELQHRVAGVRFHLSQSKES